MTKRREPKQRDERRIKLDPMEWRDAMKGREPKARDDKRPSTESPPPK